MPASVRSAWHRDAGRALAEAGAPTDRVARQMLRAVGGGGGAVEPVDEWMLDWLARSADSAGRPGTRGGGRTPVPGGSQFPGRLGPARLAGQPARRRPVPYRRHGRGRAGGERRTGARRRARSPRGPALDAGAVPPSGRANPRSPWPRWTGRWLRQGSRPGIAPGCSRSPRGRTSTIGEVEKAGPVADSALAVASAAGDNWAMGWALHVLALVTAVQGHVTDALPLFDRALAVTQSDPALTDLRLLLQINKAVNAGQSRPVRRGTGLGRAGQEPGRPGRYGDPAGSGALRPGPAALPDGALGRRTGRGGGRARGPEGSRCGVLRSRHRRRDQLPSRRDRRGAAPPRCGRPVRPPDRTPAGGHAGPGPQPGP